MTIQEAKTGLKTYGEVIFGNAQIWETKEMINNWEEYTGRYRVAHKERHSYADGAHSYQAAGEMDAVSLTRAFEIARAINADAK